MSITKRLFNLAKAELRGAVQGISGRDAREDPPSSPPAAEREPDPPPPTEEPKRRRRRGAPVVLQEDELSRFYANLELPLGASADEVKASYRRLMRRYHPDHHQGDAERAKVATQLAQELRVAYESLMAHLERISARSGP